LSGEKKAKPCEGNAVTLAFPPAVGCRGRLAAAGRMPAGFRLGGTGRWRYALTPCDGNASTIGLWLMRPGVETRGRVKGLF